MINLGVNSTKTPFGTYWYWRANKNGHLICIGVPKDYTPSGKCVVHFHGLRRSSRLDDVQERMFPAFHILDGMPKDTLFVAPFGTVNDYSLRREYTTCRTIINLLAEIGKSTGDREWNNVTFSAHSAGGSVLPPLIQGGTLTLQVKQILLFDATYGSDVSAFKQWLQTPTHRLWSVARTDSDVLKHSLAIKGKNAKIMKSEASDHYKLVNTYFPKFMKEI